MCIFSGSTVYTFNWPEDQDFAGTIQASKVINLELELFNPYYDYTSRSIGGNVKLNQYYNEHLVFNAENLEILHRLEVESDYPSKWIRNSLFLGNGFIVKME